MSTPDWDSYDNSHIDDTPTALNTLTDVLIGIGQELAALREELAAHRPQVTNVVGASPILPGCDPDD